MSTCNCIFSLEYGGGGGVDEMFRGKWSPTPTLTLELLEAVLFV